MTCDDPLSNLGLPDLMLIVKPTKYYTATLFVALESLKNHVIENASITYRINHDSPTTTTHCCTASEVRLPRQKSWRRNNLSVTVPPKASPS